MPSIPLSVIGNTLANLAGVGHVALHNLVRDELNGRAMQIGQALGSTNNPTTTSTTYVDLTDMSVTLTTTGGDLLAWLTAVYNNDTIATGNYLALSLDAAAEVAERVFIQPVANQQFVIATQYRFASVSAASHTIKGRWKRSVGGTLTAFSTTFRGLLVLELKK